MQTEGRGLVRPFGEKIRRALQTSTVPLGRRGQLATLHTQAVRVRFVRVDLAGG